MWRIKLVAGVLLSLVCVVANADFARFVGAYSGSAQIENESRDMSVAIAKAGKGFKVKWKSVTHKSDGRVKEKEYAINFLPTARAGIYSSAMGVDVFGNAVPLDPLKGDPYVWGRIRGDTLTVFSLLIDAGGGYEMQEYHRTLASGGLDLEYKRIRNGRNLKKITVFLEKN